MAAKISEQFGYTAIYSEKCSFTWKIEKLSMHFMRKSVVASPVFQTNQGKTKWNLVLYHGVNEVVMIKLVRIKSECDNQFLNVNTSIINRLGISCCSNYKEILFTSSSQMCMVHSAEKKNLNGDFFNYLVKPFLMPNDSLTLKCDMIVSQDGCTRIYESEEDFKSRIEKDSNKSYVKYMKVILLLLFLLLLFTTAMFSVGLSVDAVIILCCLLLSVLCFNLQLVQSALQVFYDMVKLYLKRLIQTWIEKRL